MLEHRIKNLREITSHPLNRNRRVGATFRYLRWILGRRLLKDVEYAIALRPDAWVVLSSREKYAALAYCCGLYDFAEMSFLLHLLRPGDVFGDLGANVGVYSALASSAGAAVLAVEPVSDTFSRLQRTLRLNHSSGLGLNCGLGDRACTLRFTTDRGGRNRVTASAGPNTVSVTVRTVDDLVAETGLRPLLLKVDVEGFELPVFRGAASSLQASVRAVIVELNGSGREYGFADEQVHQLLLAHGFGTFEYDPVARRLVASSGINSRSFNTLYVRRSDLGWVTTRVTTALPIATGMGPV
jgi:FkbM family methyltransferase